MSSPLGFAIIGTGMVARYHATAIAQTPGARLVAVCRSDAAQTATSAAQFGVPCLGSLAAVLERSDVNAVCICTPSGLHAEQTIAAVQARKHVLVEKPMALSLADADAMIAACKQAGVCLAVALQRRSMPEFQRLQAAIATGALGKLVLGTLHMPYLRDQSYYNSAAWRGTWALDGGGALMNQGIHLVDLLLWMLGDVTEVQANFATRTHQIEVEDCITATLRFANGALGSLAATTAAAPGFPHRLDIYGERAGVQIEGEQIVRWESIDSASLYTPNTTPITAGAGASPSGISAQGHTNLLADFVAAIQGAHAPLVPGELGRRSLALVLAIYAAAHTGHTIRLAEEALFAIPSH